MEFRTLGQSGLKVSLIGVGCNNFGVRLDQDETAEVVSAALDVGCNFFDTARSYGAGKSEEFLGRALRSRRDEVIIGTKFGMEGTDPESGGSRRYIVRSVEKSLRALKTDYIDLYQLHQPDESTPIFETLDAMNALIDQGKVRYIGSSNLDGWQIADAHWAATHHGLRPFVSAQNQWSLVSRDIEADVVPACERFKIGIIPYFPLASGLLTGKATRGESPPINSRLAEERFGPRVLTDQNFDIVESVSAWASARGMSLLNVALSWLASKPLVSSVIAGARRPQQVRQNAELIGTLSRAELAELNELTVRSL